MTKYISSFTINEALFRNYLQVIPLERRRGLELLLIEGKSVDFLLKTCFSHNEYEKVFIYAGLDSGASYHQIGSQINRSVRYVHDLAQFFISEKMIQPR